MNLPRHVARLIIHPSRIACSAIMLCWGIVGAGCDQPNSPAGTSQKGGTPPAVAADTASSATRSDQTVTPPPPIHFTDVTAQSGIAFTTVCGSLPAREILEVNGGGLALIDYDNDGDLDLFVANGATMQDTENGPGSRLFRNEGDLRFTDVTSDAGIELRRWAMGVAAGDYDGDGWDDLYVACYGPNVLLRNTGSGRFEDVTEKAKVGDPRWGTSTAFGDLDNDGDLDLYCCNYLEFDAAHPPPNSRYKGEVVMAGPHGLKPQHGVLYENQGDGTFREITKESGCLPPNPAFGLNVAIIDLDLDGWQDIYVANDSMPGFYFHNLGVKDGMVRFEEIGVISGIASNMDGGNQAAMGIAFADVDDNTFPDKFITVFSSDTNTLHINIDGRFFEDRSQKYGIGMISRPYLGWACAFYDLEHDGDEDLMMFNGHVYPNATMQTMDSEFLQPPLLFAREGSRFKPLKPDTAGSWLAEPHRDRSAVWGDLDHDGDIDVIVSELNGPIRFLRNDRLSAGGSDGSWLTVELDDARPGAKNHRGLGARFELEVGGKTLRRWLFTGGGFQSSNATHVHVGIPDPAATLRLTVIWPDGHRQLIEGVQAGQRLVVKRDA